MPVYAPATVDKTCSCTTGQCDGLECLCRPRFFPGQLLTDEDLGRLDHYIVAKGRLHNRYLHGTGVVCGLEVVCNPCDDTVTVRTGYAIGPCGEDIVVCNDTAVDVADLIHAQRRQRQVKCDPYGGRPANDNCEAAQQRWILGICYDERLARGVTSLRPPPSSACRCSCGSCGGSGSSHRGDVCSCGAKTTATAAWSLAQCEPTVTCEGYRFVLTKEAPVTSDTRKTTEGELAQRVRACLTGLTGRLERLTPGNRTNAQLVELCCQLKKELRDLLETSPVHSCMLGARLNMIVCPPASATKAQITDALTQLILIAIELFRSCVCSALLPPCDVGAPDDCIPIATLTVRSSDLRVIEICNWSSRKFATTFPALGYWLGWLPLFDTLRNAISRVCCAPLRPSFGLTNNLEVKVAAASVDGTVGPPPPGMAGSTAGSGQASARQPIVTAQNTVGNIATQLAFRSSPLSGIEATVLAAMGARGPDEVALASDLETENPFASLAISRLIAPTFAQALPDDFGATMASALRGVVGTTKSTEPSPDTDDRVARLEAAVESLQKTVRSQTRTITQLRRRGGEK